MIGESAAPMAVAALLILGAAASTPLFDVPVMLSVAGSDSGGGAGIQADLKTAEALGVFGTTAIVAITAQNTQGVQAAAPIDTNLVRGQIDSVLSDMGAHCIKTGMLPTAEIIREVTAALASHSVKLRVIDPVFVAASGDVLVSPEALEVLKKVLVPTATVLTPNMPEAGVLLGREAPATVDEMRMAATELLAFGPQAVLLKGGRLAAGEEMVDVFAEQGGDVLELRYSRIDTPNTHGAGCTLASAVASELAKQAHAGRRIVIKEAVVSARTYLKGVFASSAALRVGRGQCGPLKHGGSMTLRPMASAGALLVPPLSATLWQDAEVVQLVAASEGTGFVRTLADGSLPKANFAGYVAQDKFFLEAFAQAYTLALTKVEPSDAASIVSFAALVRGVVDELRLHTEYAASWGVDMSIVTPTKECLAYVDFLKEAAANEDVAGCAAAMVPCMRLYAHLGQRLSTEASAEGGPPAGPYQQWVDVYSSDDFQGLANKLEELLDRFSLSASDERRGELRQLYVRAMELELAFFDAWSPPVAASTAKRDSDSNTEL